MTLYAYKAMGADGRIVLGRMDAANAVDLELRLKRMDLDFIRGNPVRQLGMFGGRAASRESAEHLRAADESVRGARAVLT